MEKQRMKKMVLATLIIVLAASMSLAGQTPAAEKGAAPKHIASPGEIKASAAAYGATRRANVEKVSGLLDNEAVRTQLGRLGAGAEQIKAAVAGLDDEELAYLAARADDVMAGVEGGLSKSWLWAGIGAAVVLAICVFLLTTTEY
jgi:hypothetical protein